MGTPAGRHILVVDDDDEIRCAVGEVLAAEGYEVSYAANGLEGLASLRGRRPSLVLLDMMMPVMNGWDFISEKNADPSVSSIPVLVVTASEGSGKWVLPQGACGFLKKPFDVKRLLTAVERSG